MIGFYLQELGSDRKFDFCYPSPIKSGKMEGRKKEQI